MDICIGYEIKLYFYGETPLHALLHTYPNRYELLKLDQLTVEPCVPYELFIDKFGNRCTRLLAPAGLFTLKNEAVVSIQDPLDLSDPEAQGLFILGLPYDTLEFLYASRYCEVDLLSTFAWQQFGHLPVGYPRVQAICDWVHHHIRFDYMQAHITKTAYDVFKNPQGVCRDFTHLAVTLCRCMGIPARYVTGYLGDIGVPLTPPMDFSAWFEAYLSTGWYTFDPRNNQRRLGRVVIAYGRDAADTAIITTFGSHILESFTVHTDQC